MRAIPSFIVLCLLISCKHGPVKKPALIPNPFKSVTTYQYQSTGIPDFFEALISNHLTDFKDVCEEEYQQFCQQNTINAQDSVNERMYYSLKILHELFTSQTAANCSTGEILNMPYQWHWVTPNPRHMIQFSKDKKLLVATKPTKEFGKYKSWADIDRTPYLFLRDMVSEQPGYYSKSCGTFSTFGWCSEREMAFVALTALLGMKGKVVAENNHSWSEFCISMTGEKGKVKYFQVKIDNTFKQFSWSALRKTEIGKWENYIGNAGHSKWYNDQATSARLHTKIKNHKVPVAASARIERQVVRYLKRF